MNKMEPGCRNLFIAFSEDVDVWTRTPSVGFANAGLSCSSPLANQLAS
jgi:hypothetical protein